MKEILNCITSCFHALYHTRVGKPILLISVKHWFVCGTLNKAHNECTSLLGTFHWLGSHFLPVDLWNANNSCHSTIQI